MITSHDMQEKVGGKMLKFKKNFANVKFNKATKSQTGASDSY